MEAKTPTRYFLGANSGRGFYSLYDEFTAPDAVGFLWVIKGGPGCGKSSFMKRVGAAAESAGLAVEYIHCSGDPDSLDAVRIPEKGVAYVDGTAPHVIEAIYPGAASLYLDLGSFLDAGALAGHRDEIAEINRRYKSLYAEAYRLLHAAVALLPRNHAAPDAAAAEKLEKRLSGVVSRELRRLPAPGTCTRRFLSAWSCQGRILMDDTLRGLCPRICAVDNELGLGGVFLSRLAEQAVARGYDVVLCPDPLEPEKTEAVLLPQRGLAYLAVDRTTPPVGEIYRHLRLDALAEEGLEAPERARLRRCRRESARLLDAAVETLARAKALHDALEAVYHPHVDFAGSTALAADHISWLLDD